MTRSTEIEWSINSILSPPDIMEPRRPTRVVVFFFHVVLMSFTAELWIDFMALRTLRKEFQLRTLFTTSEIWRENILGSLMKCSLLQLELSVEFWILEWTAIRNLSLNSCLKNNFQKSRFHSSLNRICWATQANGCHQPESNIFPRKIHKTNLNFSLMNRNGFEARLAIKQINLLNYRRACEIGQVIEALRLPSRSDSISLDGNLTVINSFRIEISSFS